MLLSSACSITIVLSPSPVIAASHCRSWICGPSEGEVPAVRPPLAHQPPDASVAAATRATTGADCKGCEHRLSNGSGGSDSQQQQPPPTRPPQPLPPSATQQRRKHQHQQQWQPQPVTSIATITGITAAAAAIATALRPARQSDLDRRASQGLSLDPSRGGASPAAGAHAVEYRGRVSPLGSVAIITATISISLIIAIITVIISTIKQPRQRRGRAAGSSKHARVQRRNHNMFDKTTNNVRMYIYIYIYTYIHTYIHYIYAYIYIHTCMHICIYQ